jgi:phosphoribosylformylglycinamidine synthase
MKGDSIIVIGEVDESEIGGGEYLAQCAHIEKGPLPRLDYDREIRTAQCIRGLIRDGLVHSVHDVSSGGLAVALVECCVNDYSEIGARVNPTKPPSRKDGYMFAETGARYVVSCSPQHRDQIMKRIEIENLTFSAIGEVGGDTIEIVGVASISKSEAADRYRNGLLEIMG